MDAVNSSWTTNKKYQWAFREDGMLTLVHHRGVFLLLSDKIEPMAVSLLDEAIFLSDKQHPPTGWSWVVGLWIRQGWRIQAKAGGWQVYGEDGVLKSQKVFVRADMARKWCEVRADRVGMNLRGPKPKSLPDVDSEEEDGGEE